MTEHYYCYACHTEFIIIGEYQLSICRHCGSEFIQHLETTNNDLNAFHIEFLAFIRTILDENSNTIEGVPPASEKYINTLKENIKISDTNLEICSICTDNINKGEEYNILSCNHQYHTLCILTWIKKHATCPICRKEIDIHTDSS